MLSLGRTFATLLAIWGAVSAQVACPSEVVLVPGGALP
jgi:hypothetical protein